MEHHFGRDLGRVRVHTGALAATSAHAIDASAYTVGQDIVFGAGQYHPGQKPGLNLLAHEIAHTLQRSSTSDAASLDPSELSIDAPGSATERNAREVTTPSQWARPLPAAKYSLSRQPAGQTPAEIEMPAEYVGSDEPLKVLESIVHIMAGSQVAGNYGPAGENLMHPKYYTEDSYEQEADRVADHVLTMPAQSVFSGSQP